MAEAEKVASHRMILEHPDRPGQGVIVAAGDPIPAALSGYIENTPNKVDAARNMDVADAADQAATRPNERVISSFGSASAAETREIAERTAANRRQYDERTRSELDPQGWLPREEATSRLETPRDTSGDPRDDGSTSDGSTSDGSDGGSSLADLTVPQLDKLADSLGDGKPVSYKGSKADKVAALEGKVTQAQIDQAAA